MKLEFITLQEGVILWMKFNNQQDMVFYKCYSKNEKFEILKFNYLNNNTVLVTEIEL